MNVNTQAGLAEALERYRLSFILFIFLISLGSAIRLLEYNYPRQDHIWVNLLHNGTMITQLLVLGSMLFGLRHWLALAPGKGKKLLLDSFVERTNLTAVAISWFFTLFTGMAISEWMEPEVMLYGPDKPAFEPAFYFHLLILLMTLSYSLVFLFLYRRNTGEEE